MSILGSIAATLAQYRRFHTSYNELSHMSDRDLKDLRVLRGDLPGMAWEIAESEAVATTRSAPAGLKLVHTAHR